VRVRVLQLGAAAQQPNEARRATYTRRILELVKQTKKQKLDIDNVLADTRTLQKELNSLAEKLNRTFAMTSELIFAVRTCGIHVCAA
jgi:hypothetical protein